MSELISRQAAIDELIAMREHIESRMSVIGCTAYEMAIEALREPERKTGKWIIQDNPGTGWYRVSCSECGEDVTSNIPMIGFFPHCEPLWDYCPYCGADMRGEQDG